MKTLWVILILVLLGLQYKLWLGDGNVHDLIDVENKNVAQEERNQKLMARNQSLVAEISELKSGQQALEEKARDNLGMIKPGETYYNLVE